MPTTQEMLTERCGILMTYEQLGKIMHRSPEALRITLSDNRTDWAKASTPPSSSGGAECYSVRRILRD